MFVVMTIKELYRNFLLQLQDIYSLSEATVITDRVFEKVAGIRRTDLVKDPARVLNDKTIEQLNSSLAQLQQHKPVQYVLGEGWFYHLKLKINEHVLIPRPETEELVELIIADRRSRLTDISVLDIGTGSGCIPIALKKNLPAAIINAIDVSEAALVVAKENAKDHNAAINFTQMDFLEEEQWEDLSMFDIIVSNPPYIPESEKKQIATNVLDHEPHMALFVPDNRPLLFYEKIAVFGKTHLKPNGKMYMETHSGQAGAVAALFQNIYSSVEIKNDLFGKERMVIVSY